MNILTIFLGVLAGTGIIAFLFSILIIAVIIYAVKILLDWMEVPQPIKKIA